MPASSPRNTVRPRLARRAPALHLLAYRDLLQLRLCDLDLTLRGTELPARIRTVHAELERHRIRLKPHVWLSTEWFAPDDVPGFAIPFYLTHPRLLALEAQNMGEVEGGTEAWFMQLARHETGHALDAAFGLHAREDWQATFGRFDAPYLRHYRPQPHSKRFVQHLKNWYAQSHPAEDFAETLAVWLDPRSGWRTRYRGWPVMTKLLYVDRLMRELAGREPRLRSLEQVEPLSELTQTLGEYYEAKRRRYRLERRQHYDRDLLRFFDRRPTDSGVLPAARYLRLERSAIRTLVTESTGAPIHAVDRVLGALIERCDQQQLIVSDRAVQANGHHVRKVARQVAHYVTKGHDRLTR